MEAVVLDTPVEDTLDTREDVVALQADFLLYP